LALYENTPTIYLRPRLTTNLSQTVKLFEPAFGKEAKRRSIFCLIAIFIGSAFYQNKNDAPEYKIEWGFIEKFGK